MKNVVKIAHFCIDIMPLLAFGLFGFILVKEFALGESVNIFWGWVAIIGLIVPLIRESFQTV